MCSNQITASCMYVCMYVCMYIYVYVYVCTYPQVFVCIYTPTPLISLFYNFSCGETTYNLRSAEEVRVKILKAGDNLNSMAQRIRVLGNDQNAVEGVVSSALCSGPRQELLQRRIHSTASAFLKENILSLPKLPSSQELKDLQERRK